MADWRIEPLDRAHERDEFCCGKAPLDDFIQSYATQYEKRHIGRTFVAVRPGMKRVLGYYTLASSAIPFAKLPRGSGKKLPKHAIPAALLGRLAVDTTVSAQGLGKILLVDALKRCLASAANLGIYAVIVHALDLESKRFYLPYGFAPLPENELHLFLTIARIAELFPAE